MVRRARRFEKSDAVLCEELAVVQPRPNRGLLVEDARLIDDVDQPAALFLLKPTGTAQFFFVGRRPVEVEVALRNVRAVFLGGIVEHFETIRQHGVVRFQDADELARRCVKAAIHRTRRSRCFACGLP